MRRLIALLCWVMGWGVLLIGAFLAWRLGHERWVGSVPLGSSVGLGLLVLANIVFGLLLVTVGRRTRMGPCDLRFVLLNVLLAAFVPVGTLLAALALYSTSDEWFRSGQRVTGGGH